MDDDRRLDHLTRAAVSLPMVVLVAGVVAGMLLFPAIAIATSTVQAIDRQVISSAPLPGVDRPPERSLVFDRDGDQISVLVGPENRVVVPFDKIPRMIVDTVVATEDADFWEHDGVDDTAVLRALVRNLQSGEVEQGGSTITQQYVKLALLSSEQTIARKVKEAVYATQLERQVPKEEILEGYLNLAYFGHGAYGVEAASQFYFGLPLEDLTLARTALLIGMIRRPVANDPIENPEGAQRVMNLALDRLVAEGYITDDVAERNKALRVEDLINPQSLPEPRFPFLNEYVKHLLLTDPRLGDTRAERVDKVFNGGLRVHLTIDSRLQELGIETIRDRLDEPLEDPLGGLVSMDPRNGEVLAVAVGPKPFGECGDTPPEECEVTKVNPLVPGLGGSGRQVGSAFKPILDTAALEQGISTSWSTDTSSGEPVYGCWESVGGRRVPWTPENYSQTGSGILDMPAAIQRSNNVFHAKLIAEIGPEAVVDMAHRMGIDSELMPVCSLALGSADLFAIDMVEAFSVLANGGERCEPFTINHVTDAEGQVIFDNSVTCERVVSEETADKMTTMMRRVVQSGTATRAQIGRPVAGKTGTTNNFRDAWFVGFVPQMTTAAWIGYEIPEPMYNILGYGRITGGSVPAQMWSSYMRPAVAPLAYESLPQAPLSRGFGGDAFGDEDDF